MNKMMKNMFKLVAAMTFLFVGATTVNATSAYIASNSGVNACFGMYGDERYEHYYVPAWSKVTLSGNSNWELTGFYYDGMELFIQDYLLDYDGDTYTYYNNDSYDTYSESCDNNTYSSNTNNTYGYSSVGAYNRIEVNINTQTLYHFNWNYEMDFTCHVATGVDGHETPTGWFTIIYMTKDTNLVGPGYCKHVDNWMVFYQWYDENGEVSSEAGFHDASWKDVSSSSNKSGGSNGCVNMTPSDADTLYSLVDGSTTVWIHY